MGESGSGKTTAMRTLLPDETYYIDCDGKGLSWKGWRQQYNAEKKNDFQSDDQNKILTVMKGINEKRPEIKNIVIDTANSIMIADERRRSKEKTYDKWADLAWAVYDIATTASRLRDDLNVIVLFHTQTDTDDVTGDKFVRILTNGKKLNKIGLEKYFTTVLYSKSTDDGFVFETKAKNSTAKVPLGAFETETVPNDMQSVLDALKEY
jgi:ABC-type oligopeptide transport system ATPase subunit